MMPDVTPLLKTRSRPLAAKPGRIRCEAHLAFVRRQWCCVPFCREKPVQPHHLRSCPDPEATSMKSGDNWTVPLCIKHHTGPGGVQDSPSEKAWGYAHGIGLLAIAADLWEISVLAKRYLPPGSKRR